MLRVADCSGLWGPEALWFDYKSRLLSGHCAGFQPPTREALKAEAQGLLGASIPV